MKGAIILCRPEHGGNIGAVCRAMANTGFFDLRIVGCKDDYNESDIEKMAIHAIDIWNAAKFFEPSIAGLQEAGSDCSILAATSRRMGKKRKSWGMTPEQFCNTVLGHSGGTAGIVFGNERTGLTDAEVECCSLVINIPVSQNFPSINLAHAVHIICYTLFRTHSTRHYGYQPITTAKITELTEYIRECLTGIGLYRHPGSRENAAFLAGVIARAALSEGEAQRIKKLFQRIRYVKGGVQEPPV